MYKHTHIHIDTQASTQTQTAYNETHPHVCTCAYTHIQPHEQTHTLFDILWIKTFCKSLYKIHVKCKHCVFLKQTAILLDDGTMTQNSIAHDS